MASKWTRPSWKNVSISQEQREVGLRHSISVCIVESEFERWWMRRITCKFGVYWIQILSGAASTNSSNWASPNQISRLICIIWFPTPPYRANQSSHCFSQVLWNVDLVGFHSNCFCLQQPWWIAVIRVSHRVTNRLDFFVTQVEHGNGAVPIAGDSESGVGGRLVSRFLNIQSLLIHIITSNHCEASPIQINASLDAIVARRLRLAGHRL